MEIIKHGKTYKQVICTYCDAKIGYSIADIQKYGEVFGKGFFYYIECPECGNRIMFQDIT